MPLLTPRYVVSFSFCFSSLLLLLVFLSALLILAAYVPYLLALLIFSALLFLFVLFRNGKRRTERRRERE
jgi:fatty acid desaturase